MCVKNNSEKRKGERGRCVCERNNSEKREGEREREGGVCV